MNDVTLFGPDDSAGIVSFASMAFTRMTSAPFWMRPVSLFALASLCAAFDGLSQRAGNGPRQFWIVLYDKDVDALLDGIARTRRIFGMTPLKIRQNLTTLQKAARAGFRM